MSLLMDALKRAEADDSAASTTTETTVAEDTAVAPAPDTDSLQLEPMESAAAAERIPAESAVQDVANDTPAVPDPVAKDDSKTGQIEARRAVQSMSGKRSPLKKQALYVFTGIATAGLILAAYYYLQSDQMAAPQIPPRGKLVSAPEASLITDIGNTLNETVVEPVQEAVKPDSSTNTGVAGNTTSSPEPVSAATVSESATPAETTSAETSEYKIEIHKRRTPRAIPAQLKQAYQAYREKDYQQAEQLYRQALRRFPGNQDAMLGLAAIAQLQGNRSVASYYYTEVLKADPGNRTALLALQALKGENHQLEHGSLIKHWLQSDRNNAQLHFALGNQHAANNRWKEAQQAYFEAHRLQPESADYTFNLAISLDQLGLRKEALNFYQLARELSVGSSTQFSRIQLDKRIGQLRVQVEPAL